jgi:hypothetical protein
MTPCGQDVLVVPICKAEQILRVSRHTLYRWLRDGFITGEQLTPGAPWHIRIDQTLRDKIRPEVPDGWLTLGAAAKTLGIACQTALHKVQRGELQAVHVKPRTPHRPAHPGQTRSAWTVWHTLLRATLGLR